jgi:hypothetical protein
MWYAILRSFAVVLLLFRVTNPTSFHEHNARHRPFARSVDGVKGLLRPWRKAGCAAEPV